MLDSQGMWETLSQQPAKGNHKGSGDQWLENLSRGKRTADKLLELRPPAAGIAELLTCNASHPADASGIGAPRASSSMTDASGKKMVKKGALCDGGT